MKIISELPGSQGKRGNEYVTVSVRHVFYGECLFVVVSLNICGCVGKWQHKDRAQNVRELNSDELPGSQGKKENWYITMSH